MRAFLFAFGIVMACGGTEPPRETTPSPETSGPTTTSPADTLRCASDVDCTVIDAVCPGWQAVNVASRASVLEQTRALQAVASCMALTAPLPPTTVRCDDAQCALIELDHPEWRACASASECTAVEGVCGNVDAAATSSVDAMRASYADMAMRVRCAQRQTPPATPDCRAGLCVPR
jgi:hypothetical protein